MKNCLYQSRDQTSFFECNISLYSENNFDLKWYDEIQQFLLLCNILCNCFEEPRALRFELIYLLAILVHMFVISKDANLTFSCTGISFKTLYFKKRAGDWNA